MTQELDQAIKDKYKKLFESLPEVELYFSYTDVKKRPTNEKAEYILDLIVETSTKFGVKMSTDEKVGNFMKWLTFWKKWQSELTLVEIKNIIDQIELFRPYDEYLPKTKWNQRVKKINTCPKGHQC